MIVAGDVIDGDGGGGGISRGISRGIGRGIGRGSSRISGGANGACNSRGSWFDVYSTPPGFHSIRCVDLDNLEWKLTVNAFEDVLGQLELNKMGACEACVCLLSVK